MIDLLKQYIASEASAERRANRLREAIQLLCLKILQDKGYFSNIAFVGGTALRVIYDARRFSEDLDFSVIRKAGYGFSSLILAVKREFGLYGLDAEVKTNIKKTVQGSMIKFPGLLKMMGLSNLETQKLSIKLEVDSNPPAGWALENTVVNKLFVLNIAHYAIESLFSTKLHACFFRRYTKGRDFYDLVWYLSKKVNPNYKLLNNAIKQTEGHDPKLSVKNIKDFLLGRLEEIDFESVKKDVERFLEDKGELDILDKAIISKLISNNL